MRLSLASTLCNRDATTDTDERLANCFVDGDVREPYPNVTKRPGLTSRYTLGLGTADATIGLLLFSFQTPGVPGIAGTETLVGVRGDVLTRPVV